MDFLEIVFSLFTLLVIEIVLGIDNLIFLAILVEKLPKEKRRRARRWGLTFAWVTRLILLFTAVWAVGLVHPLFTWGDFAFSVRDLFLFCGGIFLLIKATQEIHYEVEKSNMDKKDTLSGGMISFNAVIIQVALMDVIFSLDSILTAVVLTNHFWIMALAISCSILVMLYASEPVSVFIEKHPSIKILVLSFLLLIGMVLIAEGFSFHVPRTYIYFAMLFSLGVEMLNILKKKRRKRKQIKKKIHR